jgi:HTH-type transcriptional regulator / antitoxin HigA
MTNSRQNQYVPDYIVTPGEVIEEYLDSYGMSQAELAARTGLTKKTINEIIKGKAPVTSDTSLKLERALGRPAHFWSNLERQFQEDRIRLAEKERLEAYLGWLKKVPVASMVKLGWLSKHKEKLAQLEEVLRFFAVASPDQWETVWREHQVAYRQTQRFETCAEAVSAWLRQGDIQAQKIQCAPFDRKKFFIGLESIRALTREEPQVFLPRLADLCASAGVAVVFVRELPKTGVSGATRWLGDKAVIQLSLRYKSNDQLWFTFFHEAGHILKHGRKEIFIESNDFCGEKEEEANAFARDVLIPRDELRRFLQRWNRSNEGIETFANRIGIAPGIVVGRLQHEKILANSHGNKLKIYYRWASEEAA